MNALIDLLDKERMRHSVQADVPTPLYHQMYSLLRKNIIDGTIEFGSKMPTEQELAEVFGVSRITSKRAMDDLAAEGLVERRRGKGTHVVYKYEPKSYQAPLIGDLKNLENFSQNSKVKVLDVAEMVPPAEIRAELGLPEGAAATRVIRLRLNEEKVPFAYYTSWTNAKIKNYTKRSLESASRFEILRSGGLKISRVEQTLSAELAGAEIARLLGIQSGDALLSLVRRSYDNSGSLVDILYGLYNPELFHYQMSMKLGS